MPNLLRELPEVGELLHLRPVSLVVQPEEAEDLVEPSFSTRLYEWKLAALRKLASEAKNRSA